VPVISGMALILVSDYLGWNAASGTDLKGNHAIEKLHTKNTRK
jgi:hypothetical protein